MAVFGEALDRLQTGGKAFELILPTMPHLLEEVSEGVRAGRWRRGSWSAKRRSARRFGLRRGVGQVGHRDARAGARKGADGGSLPHGGAGGLDRQADDQHHVCDPGKSRHRRERGAGIPSGELHGRQTRQRACARYCPIHRCASGSSRPLRELTASCRRVASLPASAPRTSFWRCCENPEGLASRSVPMERRSRAECDIRPRDLGVYFRLSMST